ncbi:HEAT repeat domain-containing protein [Salinispira pacifica]
MAEKRRIIVTLVVLVLAAGSVIAQQSSASAASSSGSGGSGSNKDVTIEQLYLSQDIELQILRSQATSNDRQVQMLALQTIRSMSQDGSIQNNPGVGAVLQALATEGLQRQVREGNQIVNNYPDVRREACNLLGEMGGTAAKDTLLTVLLEDKEPMVVAEAVYALGKIGINDNNDVASHIAWVLNHETAKAAPDNNLAFACLLAVEKLSAKTGGVSDPEVINALLNVASGNYIRDVRLKAIDVIYKLRKQQQQQKG